mgnify:CR=1 FL=1
MCRVGDIILIDNYKDNESLLKRHSFVVMSDENGEIEGLPYDLICSVLSSFKSEEQRKRKLSYPGNFPIAHDDTITNPHNNKNGFIKLDQLYYFNKEKISYKVIGSVKPDIFELLIDFLENSQFAIYDIIDNL